ncbi:hypothetical protein DFH11DRAFT_1880057 [Phellopilus nigrolimitatus]|nr:hypothetical protein DFH11DRAFT_1880057 [Phellopilus nigrolimitatus]
MLRDERITRLYWTAHRHGKKRKLKGTGGFSVSRPPQHFFNYEEVVEAHRRRAVAKRNQSNEIMKFTRQEDGAENEANVDLSIVAEGDNAPVVGQRNAMTRIVALATPGSPLLRVLTARAFVPLAALAASAACSVRSPPPPPSSSRSRSSWRAGPLAGEREAEGRASTADAW